MDELNLYDDLDEFQEQQNKKSKELQDAEEKYQESLKTIEELRVKNKTLKKNIRCMELGFQSLLDTARSEIKRKDKEIERLRKEKDDICFRRKIRDKSENRNEIRELPQHNSSKSNNSKDEFSTTKSLPHSSEDERKESFKCNSFRNEDRDKLNQHKRKSDNRYEYDNHKRAKKSDDKESRTNYREKEYETNNRSNKNHNNERSDYDRPSSSRTNHGKHSDSNYSRGDKYDSKGDKYDSRGDKYDNKYGHFERNSIYESRKNIDKYSNKISRSPQRNKVTHTTTTRDHYQSEKNHRTESEESHKTIDKDRGNKMSENTENKDKKKSVISIKEYASKINNDTQNEENKIENKNAKDAQETNKLSTPRKVALFNEHFGESASDSSTSSTMKNSLLNNIKDIISKSSQIEVESSDTISPGDHPDITNSITTPKGLTTQPILNSFETKHSDSPAMDKCFIGTQMNKENIKTADCVEVIEILDDDIANEIEFLQIPGLDLCQPNRKGENTNKYMDTVLTIANNEKVFNEKLENVAGKSLIAESETNKIDNATERCNTDLSDKPNIILNTTAGSDSHSNINKLKNITVKEVVHNFFSKKNNTFEKANAIVEIPSTENIQEKKTVAETFDKFTDEIIIIERIKTSGMILKNPYNKNKSPQKGDKDSNKVTEFVENKAQEKIVTLELSVDTQTQVNEKNIQSNEKENTSLGHKNITRTELTESKTPKKSIISNSVEPEACTVVSKTFADNIVDNSDEVQNTNRNCSGVLPIDMSKSVCHSDSLSNSTDNKNQSEQNIINAIAFNVAETSIRENIEEFKTAALTVAAQEVTRVPQSEEENISPENSSKTMETEANLVGQELLVNEEQNISGTKPDIEENFIETKSISKESLNNSANDKHPETLVAGNFSNQQECTVEENASSKRQTENSSNNKDFSETEENVSSGSIVISKSDLKDTKQIALLKETPVDNSLENTSKETDNDTQVYECNEDVIMKLQEPLDKSSTKYSNSSENVINSYETESHGDLNSETLKLINDTEEKNLTKIAYGTNIIKTFVQASKNENQTLKLFDALEATEDGKAAKVTEKTYGLKNTDIFISKQDADNEKPSATVTFINSEETPCDSIAITEEIEEDDTTITPDLIENSANMISEEMATKTTFDSSKLIQRNEIIDPKLPETSKRDTNVCAIDTWKSVYNSEMLADNSKENTVKTCHISENHAKLSSVIIHVESAASKSAKETNFLNKNQNTDDNIINKNLMHSEIPAIADHDISEIPLAKSAVANSTKEIDFPNQNQNTNQNFIPATEISHVSQNINNSKSFCLINTQTFEIIARENNDKINLKSDQELSVNTIKKQTPDKKLQGNQETPNNIILNGAEKFLKNEKTTVDFPAKSIQHETQSLEASTKSVEIEKKKPNEFDEINYNSNINKEFEFTERVENKSDEQSPNELTTNSETCIDLQSLKKVYLPLKIALPIGCKILNVMNTQNTVTINHQSKQYDYPNAVNNDQVATTSAKCSHSMGQQLTKVEPNEAEKVIDEKVAIKQRLVRSKSDDELILKSNKNSEKELLTFAKQAQEEQTKLIGNTNEMDRNCKVTLLPILLKNKQQYLPEDIPKTCTPSSSLKRVFTREINIEGEIVEISKPVTEISNKEVNTTQNKPQLMENETVHKQDKTSNPNVCTLDKTQIHTISSALPEMINSFSVLPSISTNFPTPSNFSGIFSKHSSSSVATEDDNKFKKKSLHCAVKRREYILPAASVLCNVDNLENATKANKKLHWELLDNKSEMTEIEDDADIETTDDELPKIKAEPIDNASVSPKQCNDQTKLVELSKAKTPSPSETEIQLDDEDDLREQEKPSIVKKVKNSKIYKHKLCKKVKDIDRESSLTMQMPFPTVCSKRPVGRPRKLDKIVKDKMEIKISPKKRGRKSKMKLIDEKVQSKLNACHEEYTLETKASQAHSRATNNSDMANNLENSVKILSTSVERLDICDKTCTSNESLKLTPCFDKQIKDCEAEDANSASMIYHKRDSSTDNSNESVQKNLVNNDTQVFVSEQNNHSLTSEQNKSNKTEDNHLTTNRDTEINKSDKADTSSVETKFIEKSIVLPKTTESVVKDSELPSCSKVNQDNALLIRSDTETSEELNQDSVKEKSFKKDETLRNILFKNILKSKFKNKVTPLISIKEMGSKGRPLKGHLSSFRIPKINRDADEIIDNSWKLETYVELDEDATQDQITNTETNHDKQNSNITLKEKNTKEVDKKIENTIDCQEYKQISKISENNIKEQNIAPNKHSNKEAKQDHKKTEITSKTGKRKLYSPELYDEEIGPNDNSSKMPTDVRNSHNLQTNIADSNLLANTDTVEGISSNDCTKSHRKPINIHRRIVDSSSDEDDSNDTVKQFSNECDATTETRNPVANTQKLQVVSKSNETKKSILVRRKSLYNERSSSEVIKTEEIKTMKPVRKKSVSFETAQIEHNRKTEENTIITTKEQQSGATSKSNTIENSNNCSGDQKLPVKRIKSTKEQDKPSSQPKGIKTEHMTSKLQSDTVHLKETVNRKVEETTIIPVEEQQRGAASKSNLIGKRNKCSGDQVLPVKSIKSSPEEGKVIDNNIKIMSTQHNIQLSRNKTENQASELQSDTSDISKSVGKNLKVPADKTGLTTKSIPSLKMRRKSMCIEKSMCNKEEVTQDNTHSLSDPSTAQLSTRVVKLKKDVNQSNEISKTESKNLKESKDKSNQLTKPITSLKMRRKSMYAERRSSIDNEAKEMELDKSKREIESNQGIDSSSEVTPKISIKIRRKSTSQGQNLYACSDDQNMSNKDEHKSSSKESKKSKQNLEIRSNNAKLDLQNDQNMEPCIKSLTVINQQKQIEVRKKSTNQQTVLPTCKISVNEDPSISLTYQPPIKKGRKSIPEPSLIKSNREKENISDSTILLTKETNIQLREQSANQPLKDQDVKKDSIESTKSNKLKEEKCVKNLLQNVDNCNTKDMITLESSNCKQGVEKKSENYETVISTAKVLQQQQQQSLKIDNSQNSEAESDSHIFKIPQEPAKQRTRLVASSDDNESPIKDTPMIPSENKTPPSTASKTKRRRKRAVKVLSVSMESPANISNNSLQQSSDQTSPPTSLLTSPHTSPHMSPNTFPFTSPRISPLTSPNHPIFHTEISTQSTEFVASMPVTPNLQDNKFQEIDSKLHAIFQSPQYTVDYKISSPVDTANLSVLPPPFNDSNSENILNKTTDSNQENTESSVNTSPANESSALAHNCTEIKHISLGTSDYRFEKVSDNVINLFISRKRKRKRNSGNQNAINLNNTN